MLLLVTELYNIYTSQTIPNFVKKVVKAHMLYLVCDVKNPIQYLSCGNLVNNKSFLHPDRILDSHVLIIVRKGNLHINSAGNNYDIGPNEFILLFSGQHHYGYKPSEEPLSYYWTHFTIFDPNYKFYSPTTLQRYLDVWNAAPTYTPFTMYNYILPEYGSLAEGNRSTTFILQLIDTAKRENYAATYRCHYILSFLLLELGVESISNFRLSSQDIPYTIVNIIEWIRLYYNQTLTVQDIADRYGYNPTYLSSLFKKYTGYPLISYINRTRIAISKNLLTTDTTLRIHIISQLCGFKDEKLFMKVFKNVEGITPTQYRANFSKIHINKV